MYTYIKGDRVRYAVTYCSCISFYISLYTVYIPLYYYYLRYVSYLQFIY